VWLWACKVSASLMPFIRCSAAGFLFGTRMGLNASLG
jgi:hypothetical protein